MNAARSGATPPPDGLRRSQIIDALHALELARIGWQEPLAAVGCINLHEHEEEADAILAAAATPPAAPDGLPTVEAER